MKKDDFESRLEEAKQILETLMNPELTIEQSVKAYEDGTRALKEAQKLLEQAKTQIEAVRNAPSEDDPS